MISSILPPLTSTYISAEKTRRSLRSSESSVLREFPFRPTAPSSSITTFELPSPINDNRAHIFWISPQGVMVQSGFRLIRPFSIRRSENHLRYSMSDGLSTRRTFLPVNNVCVISNPSAAFSGTRVSASELRIRSPTLVPRYFSLPSCDTSTTSSTVRALRSLRASSMKGEWVV